MAHLFQDSKKRYIWEQRDFIWPWDGLPKHIECEIGSHTNQYAKKIKWKNYSNSWDGKKGLELQYVWVYILHTIECPEAINLH